MNSHDEQKASPKPNYVLERDLTGLKQVTISLITDEYLCCFTGFVPKDPDRGVTIKITVTDFKNDKPQEFDCYESVKFLSCFTTVFGLPAQHTTLLLMSIINTTRTICLLNNAKQHYVQSAFDASKCAKEARMQGLSDVADVHVGNAKFYDTKACSETGAIDRRWKKFNQEFQSILNSPVTP